MEKNVGQISAIWISAYAPENTKLIWYDVSEAVHKIYETSTGTWKSINPQVVTNSTIANLRTIAQGSGLSVGKFYYLTDVGTLAIAITTTKIWYVDSHGNYIVNDLAASVQYYVNSTNLLIDGTTGTWSSANGTLNFSFSSVESGSNIQPANDYIVMRRNSSGTLSWLKFKLQALVSSASGNSIRWNNGLYFSFTDAISAVKNQPSGLVGYEKHNNDVQSIQNSINQIANSLNGFVTEANNYTDGKVTEQYIYNTLLHTTAWSLLENPPALPGSLPLHSILNIILSWINNLQSANKIFLGSGFSPNGRQGDPNYMDTVRAAIEKLIYKQNSFIDSWVCDIRSYISSGSILPQKKVYYYGVYPLECRTLRYGDDELPTLVLGMYRTKEEEDENPYPSRIFVYMMPDESSDYVFYDLYDWDLAPKAFRDAFNPTVSPWHTEFSPTWLSTQGQVGDEIGKFEGDEATFTATLEGALYLLSKWYRDHFNVNQSWNDNWYCFGYGFVYDSLNRIRMYPRVKITENNLLIQLNAGVFNETPYDRESADLLTTDVNNNASCLFIAIADNTIWSKLLAKYGLNTIFYLGIPVYVCDKTYSDSDGDNNIAAGFLYGCLIQSTDVSGNSNFLKLIPQFIQATIIKG